jgi:hypothetical protein
VSLIEFGDDGVNAIPQFDQLPKRALLVGDHLVNASLKIFLAGNARARDVFSFMLQKLAAISSGLKAKLASPQ